MPTKSQIFAYRVHHLDTDGELLEVIERETIAANHKAAYLLAWREACEFFLPRCGESVKLIKLVTGGIEKLGDEQCH